MATHLRMTLTIDGVTPAQRRLLRSMMLGYGTHNLAQVIQSLQAIESQIMSYDSGVGRVRIGSQRETYENGAPAPAHAPVATAAPVVTTDVREVNRRLDELRGMVERLLLPTELRNLPNASDALAVLSLDTPTTILTEPV